jgi:hypothetical protein
MYIARFFYEFALKDRDEALGLVMREHRRAQQLGLTARVLVPFTSSSTDVSLQFEMDVHDLNELETFRHQELGQPQESHVRRSAEAFAVPPHVEIFHLRASYEATAAHQLIKLLGTDDSDWFVRVRANCCAGFFEPVQ